jgi:diaminohydroxyphosphoribosylaminopyrimidine deaminase / 5-amino-6-(5-phosphoribosylamino)uracil reductase
LRKNSHFTDDVRHMARALQLAKRGLYTTDPNPRVGCVIVRDGQVVGEGWHRRAGEPHAEVHALAAAGQQAHGATAYVSLEPCCHHGRTPPCSEALVKAGIVRVVAAMPDPNPRVASQGIADLEKAGIRVDIGLLQAESERLNPGFISRMTRGRPYLRVKLAASLDGRTALANGQSKWITGEAARADVQRLRARSSVILTGIGTVLADDPSLTVRDLDIGRQPLRVVVDPQLRMHPAARMLTLPGSTLVVTSEQNANAAAALRAAGAEVFGLPVVSERMNLKLLLEHLAAREVNEVLVEAGATLCGELLRAGLVDELVLYLAPHLLGSGARGLFNIPGLEDMADRIALDIQDVRAIGKDWRITAKLKISS